MSLSNNVVDLVPDAMKLAPPAVVSGISAAGVTLEDWAYIVTIIYTLMMIGRMIYKSIRDRKIVD